MSAFGFTVAESCTSMFSSTHVIPLISFWATITGVADDGEWWYPACRCGKVVKADNGVYYCAICVKLEVRDSTDVTYLTGKNCIDILNSFKEGDDCTGYLAELMNLIGRKMLFKVVNTTVSSSLDIGMFRVQGVCDDENNISMYCLEGSDLPTDEAIKVSCFGPIVDLSYDDPVGAEQCLEFVSDLIISPQPSENLSSDLMTPPCDLKRKTWFTNGESFGEPIPMRKRSTKAFKK
ncbi:hypothetical protein RIF29_14895 [Crotalaria pallida]|uniref:Replication factor A C-terminal domain-containing protein n=1 Tax=Crotalaria pallida TaxID=3830 RepID=A0AAN9FEM1_CROPI